MKKNTSFHVIVLTMLIIVCRFHYEAKGQVQGKWSGTVSYTEIVTGIGGFTREKTVHVEFRDNEGTGTVTDHGKDVLGSTDCEGSGKAILAHVGINYGDSTYTIHVMSPGCIGTSFSKLNGQTAPFGPEITDIVISDKSLRSPNVLAGTETRTADVVPGSYTATITTTWNLSRTIDAEELIVTPSDYDNWLPKPGRNEFTKGSVMNISLKVQRRNGQPLTLKAKSFELRLSNTSKEPGITLNAPLVPDDPLSDLRLLPLTIAESKEENQFITIPCRDGSTGKAYIGSYDGGGWTTLTVEAILEDNSHIKGCLLVSGGETEIPIPKRNPGTKIASSWLAANGNPGEMDDNELDDALKSAGNNHPGDGLTAYEEYRGVISEGKFLRLDPKKQELGVRIKRSEFALFSEGLKWFEKASFIKVVRFYETEISRDRRLNKNANSAHNYDQFVLRLEKRNLPTGVLGTAYRGPALPAITDPVVIDWDQVQSTFQYRVRNESPSRLLYTQAEMMAWAAAHELAHGISAYHHGDDLTEPDQEAQPLDPTRIFDRHRNPITLRPYRLVIIGSRGSVESGDISCIMAYNPYYLWGYAVGDDGAKIFNQIPLLSVGNTMCKSRDGKGINASLGYFGDASKGNCLSQIKLRN